MKRLQLRCLFFSTVLHGVLGVLVIFGVGFSAGRKGEPVLPLIMVPMTVTVIDDPMFGGGDPRPPGPESKTPPVAKPEPTPLPAAPPQAPPELKPEPKVEPKAEPNPPKVIEKPAPEPEESQPAKPAKTADLPKVPPSAELTPPSGKEKDDRAPSPKRKIDLTQRTTRSAVAGSPSRDTRRADREAAEQARQAARNAWRSQVAGTLGSLRQNLSASTTVELTGGGGVGGTGGEFYANYTQVIRSLYDQAWRDPEDVADLSLTCSVMVTIARDGRIVGATPVRRSGNAAMDKSVQQALDRVTRVPAFPASSTDTERTFKINFNLKEKRLMG